MDKQVETHLDEIKEKLLARGTGVQKAGFAEKTAHKMYTKMVQNAPETIWAAFQVTDECAAVESAPEYALPAASNWKSICRPQERGMSGVLRLCPCLSQNGSAVYPSPAGKESNSIF